ncbi:tRNA(m(1)G37)methyltransferase [Neophaeococcomyces mojaviensis]|uniref:tRNA(M(1)G37)methyltransferase n=1 Tax=Neophaeococcomyces mojaviensis TaxID=3383035 RepID=A0ACC3A8E6_9EURO|nr:tRNA(m(1)G37)methyltransferase [Knufia sp. JES_112]
MNNLSVAELARPPINRDMKVLDRSFFQTKLQTSAITVFDPKDIQKVKSKLGASRDLLLATTIKPVRDDDTTPGAKCIMLLPHVKANDPSTWSEHWSNFVMNGAAKVRPFELVLSYDDWSMSDILGAILPELSEDEGQNPSGFAQVGHVAHLNLREQFLPYKYLIGQVLLDKNHGVKTVINKLQDVGTESVFRTFPYEVLAGPDDLDVTVHHANCEFKFNFGEVYWNTRNGHEHERLVASFKEGQAVCDVMAGVGPFAVPAGKKQIWVRANDLNPAGFRAMVAAIRANKVEPFVRAYNMDGREFIKSATQDLLTNRRTFQKKPKTVLSRKATAEEKQRSAEYAASNTIELEEPKTFDHFIMNLPASAIEFLDAYKGLYRGQENLFVDRKLPMIHVYTFQARDEDDNEEKEKVELLGRLSQYLGHDLDKERDEVTLHRARLVAPKKLFYCASFRLPAAIAFAAD